MQHMTQRLVTVAVTTSPWEAHVLRGLMESEGIPAVLFNEHHVWANWSMSQALGGVEIQVPAEFAPSAAGVLDHRTKGLYFSALTEAFSARGEDITDTPSGITPQRWLTEIALASCMLFACGVTFPPQSRFRQVDVS